MRPRYTEAIMLGRKSEAKMAGKGIAPTMARLSIILAIVASISLGAQAQQQGGSAAAQRSDYVGPTADSIRPYKAAGRDPFKKSVKPRNPKAASAIERKAKLLGFPALDVRRAQFRQKVEEARARDIPEPDPVAQYLVSELDITGVFRDDRGYGAFVRAVPTGTTFFIRSGVRCYNGEVLRIESDESDTDGSKVLFREVSYVELNGKQSQQERVVAKLPSLPQKAR